MAPLFTIIILLSLFITTNSQSNDNQTIECYATDGSIIESCNGFCGSSTIQTISIGVENASCPIIQGITSSTDPELPYITTDDDHQCINQITGCGTSWLCQMLTDNGTSCSSADFRFNIYELQCVQHDDDHHDGDELLFATKQQYTQFKTNQFCCDTNLCTMDESTTCQYNEMYQEFMSDLFHCLYSENAVNNEYNQVNHCGATFDSNSYNDTCDYLISQSYSIYGCKCKSSFWIGLFLPYIYHIFIRTTLT